MDKIIRDFNLDLSDLPAAGEVRNFAIAGDNGAAFKLEIKDNATNYYYNFTTNAFQVAQADLEKSITSHSYEGYINFPNTITTDTVNGAVSSGIKVVMDTAVANTMAVGDRVTGNAILNKTVVTVASLNPDGDNTSEFSLSTAVVIADDTTLSFSGDDQYDIYLYAIPGTKHVDYSEVRFKDGSIDINSSTGSNSLMMQKVIYQYADVLLTMGMFSIGSAITLSNTDATLNTSRGKTQGKIPFRVSTTSASGESFTITKQPTHYDILSFAALTVGSAPEDLPGENIYPTARAAFTGDDINGAIVSGSVVRMDNTDLSAVIAIGDKITSPETSSDVDGAVSGGVKVVIDDNVAGIMAVGDQITSATTGSDINSIVVIVAELNPDEDNVKEFSMSQAVTLEDGERLTFSSKINRSLTTVTVVETSGTATDFTMSQAIQFRDNQPLTFTPQMNYQWPLDDVNKLKSGMIVLTGSNVTTDTRVGDYQDAITINEGTENEEIIIRNTANAINTKSQTPTITKGLITTQPGNVIFDKQQVLVLASDAIKVGGYGEDSILRIHGWDIKFSNLAITLNPIVTTTTSASSASTSVAVTARDGILNGTSTVSGIGIDPSVGDPKVNSGASATGAGTIVLSAAQTLESGISLTFDGAGKEAVITGNMEIRKVGTGSPTLRFDVGRFLTSA